MAMKKMQTVTDVDLREKRVLVRVDFNVPLDGDKVANNSRICAALPTINYLLGQSAKVILMSHLGRPDGKKNLKYSLRPVAQELSSLLNRPVLFLDDCIGSDVAATIDELDDGSVVLLENLRFHGDEEANGDEFAAKLASYGDAYVNDAFGTAHRAHASTVGVPRLLPIKVAGFLMQKELEFLGNRTSNPERPFTVILGGAKVSDKIGVIDALLDRCDCMLIGGAMAYTFQLARGENTGNSPVEKDRVGDAIGAVEKAKEKGVELILPVDTLCTDFLDFPAKKVGKLQTISGQIPDGWQGVDIGQKTIGLFAKAIAKAKTILWNGPVGIFEIPQCAEGTFAVAKFVGDSKALSIVGGGDSIDALAKSGRSNDVTFISTGGGASLEFLEGKELPGASALNWTS
ncbi:MAG: phosphoglycerate kinase [Puniceicoccales bacterium]|jgi:3-phosphoglycerate kinase|nr:phosphoglycerate kinase [Puniceicoccales bacterium]